MGRDANLLRSPPSFASPVLVGGKLPLQYDRGRRKLELPGNEQLESKMITSRPLVLPWEQSCDKTRRESRRKEADLSDGGVLGVGPQTAFRDRAASSVTVARRRRRCPALTAAG